MRQTGFGSIEEWRGNLVESFSVEPDKPYSGLPISPVDEPASKRTIEGT